MHKHYIINKAVEFHPATSKLRDLKNPDKVVILNSPAGRCLLLLIERKGEIVTQQEFMDIVWHRCGMMVSPNTFYQNICILRKGLKKIGFINDPVVTIPRIGLTLASDTKITIEETTACIQLERIVDEDAQKGAVLTISDSVNEQQSSETPGVYERNDDPPLSINFSANDKQIVLVNKSPERIILLVIILLAVILIAGAGFISLRAFQENRYFDHYRFVVAEYGCRFFLNKHISLENDKEQALDYGKQFKASCNKYPWIYINRYAMLPRASVIRCNKPMTEPNQCVSDYFLEGL